MDTEIDTEAYPPGELIREEMEERGWSQQDLANVMGTSQVTVSQLLNAKRSVTTATANALATAFGTSAELWLNLDARYRLHLDCPTGVGKSISVLRATLYSKAPVRLMIKRGWIPQEKDVGALEKSVLSFVEQPSLNAEWVFDHAARKSGSGAYGITSPLQFAWLCRARQLARVTNVRGKWRDVMINDLTTEISRLIQSAPALQNLPRVLSEFGIRLVIVERLPGMKMDGATFRLGTGEPVIALSITHDRIDNLWQTVMHEVGHIANNDRLAVDAEILHEDAEKPEAEQRADQFAIEHLVPQAMLEDFCNRLFPLFSHVRIIGFSSIHKVHPGIVVGQLHHRGKKNRGLEYTHFRKLLVPVRKFLIENAITDGWGKVVPLDLDAQ